ncbi:unnamed protein product [Prunus armeniaca]
MPVTPCCWATSALQDCWLTTGEAVPSGSSQIVAPRSSTDKPRPQTWTGHGEGRTRPGRSPRFRSNRSPFHRQGSRRGRAPRTTGTASPLDQAVEKFITGNRARTGRPIVDHRASASSHP